MQRPALAEAGLVHLRAQVVLVVDEPLAAQLPQQTEQPVRVRRIARLEDVEALVTVHAS